MEEITLFGAKFKVRGSFVRPRGSVARCAGTQDTAFAAAKERPGLTGGVITSIFGPLSDFARMLDAVSAHAVGKPVMNSSLLFTPVRIGE
jgi:hypothetical protein